MVSRVLLGIWTAFDFLLMAAGIVSLVLSMVWRAPDVLRNMVLSPADLIAGTVLGIALLVTFAISIAGVIQRNHVNIGLIALNYALLLDAIGVVVIGTLVWWSSLRERAGFRKLWLAASSDSRVILQDKLKCCGYFNGSDGVVIGGAFCASQDFVNNLNPTVASNFCVTPITKFANSTLDAIFT
ncbi:hypothetical protein AX15_002970 [Amanita polypyramis BW_CC]|nr:hypothetical protein AX15_002970 [Amanita polypyramis BW_CC]